jgi:chemotaxis protein methyltransferase CheR
MPPSIAGKVSAVRQEQKIAPENLRFLCRTIYEDSGILVDESKAYLLEARLTPIAKGESDGTLDGLCHLIRANSTPGIRRKVVEAMTTNETLFFRDARPFEALQGQVIPQLVQKKAGQRRLRVWCAACSSGQEPYSLAMMWLEMAISGWSIDILGTDLSEEVLAKAQGGRYSLLEVNRGLPAKYLVKYFTRMNMEWELKAEVRRMVRWQKFNLKDSMRSLGEFDLVLCRNVLIYFDLETKRRILEGIRQVLVKDGYLILGGSETTLNVDERFTRTQFGLAVMYQSPH